MPVDIANILDILNAITNMEIDRLRMADLVEAALSRYVDDPATKATSGGVVIKLDDGHYWLWTTKGAWHATPVTFKLRRSVTDDAVLLSVCGKQVQWTPSIGLGFFAAVVEAR